MSGSFMEEVEESVGRGESRVGEESGGKGEGGGEGSSSRFSGFRHRRHGKNQRGIMMAVHFFNASLPELMQHLEENHGTFSVARESRNFEFLA
ncbi:hypothetical protein BGX26_006445, partial [Mortierella sp. AD094]